jgi:Domain of unknown function (DUF4331)
VHSTAVTRKPFLLIAALAAGALAIVLLLVYGPSPHGAKASSHSEAPLISQDPRADNTDLYAFVSPDDPSTVADETNTVTMIANYIPLEAPASGPNFYSFDDSVLYEIKIDNNGDGADDIGYQFRFHTATRNGNTFLYNIGPIDSLSDTDWNRPQTYSVTLVHFKKDGKVEEGGPNKPVVLGDNIPTPPDNVGPRSTPNYASLAAAAVTDLGGGVKVFAGQRDDPFYVDLGSIFDLAGLRPFNSFHLIQSPFAPTEDGVDALTNYNTHSIEIQVPISQVAQTANKNIGIYASASRQKETVLKNDGTKDGHGPWVQISRLGNPLINEVVIPLGDKDFWNRSEPEDDSQFEHYYSSPEVSRLENLLYGRPPTACTGPNHCGPPNGHVGGALENIDETGRTDLTAILLTGFRDTASGFNLNFTGDTQADLLRLNTDIKPGVNGACGLGGPTPAEPDRLGVLDGDLCGYPNGRRLEDDIVDIDLRVFAQGYGAALNGLFGLPNKSPNNQLGDGVDTNDKSFTHTFPYVANPSQGYEVP